jgi:anti-sigma factor RsiW
MTDLSQKLSAYLDGELDAASAEAIEVRLATDPTAQAELDALMQADALAQEQFEAQLNDPVPFALAQQIKSTPLTARPAPQPRPIWGALAASLVVFALGGIGGYTLKGQTTPVQTAGWLADIADYHAVYASQGRHLVEVSADEADHIETWLGNTVGASFTIPDLSGFALTFEGGRLLVANGKPVAQLMYRDADGIVVALCLQRSTSPADGSPTFKEQTINGFDFVSWSADGADYVVIGPNGQPDLSEIATTAALDI